MRLPFKDFTRNEWILWIVSIVIVVTSNLVSSNFDCLILIAAMIGVTAVLFGAKGNGWGQVLIVVFSILYGVISWRFRYWGEMVTYLGMSMPMAIWAAVIWFRNPSEENEDAVKIRVITKFHWGILSVLSLIVSVVFYFLLKWFKTPNLFVSTLSITTSFFAASLTLLRSSYFAFFYAMNDLILIILWVLAAIKDPVYIPVIVNFMIFFINDMYGFISWKHREKR